MLGFRDTRDLAEVLPAKEWRAMKKNLGVDTCQDLIDWLPRTYSRNGAQVGITDATEGELVTCIGHVVDVSAHRAKNGVYITEVTIDDGQSRIRATFFRSTWIQRALPRGTRAMFSGKVKKFRGQVSLQHPSYLTLPDAPTAYTGAATVTDMFRYEPGDDVAQALAQREYIPIYPIRAKATSWRIMEAVDTVLETLPPVPEPLDFAPADLPTFDAALRGIHHPGPEGPDPHLRRWKYNEAFALACVMALRRADTDHRRAHPCPPAESGARAELLADLPYELTDGQRAVLEEISADLTHTRPMTRLLQGEVGSGKTIVALAAMLQAVDAGYQCAFLAPTEVLAAQHAATLRDLLGDLDVTVVVLTGSLRTKQRQQVLLDIVAGNADIVVGTHALFQDTVEFFGLGLVVVDEQHRFGVEQRERLRLKGASTTPHLLVMTATPIPRTVAMTVFGDLSVSTLRQLPGGRRPVHTYAVPVDKPAWLERTWVRIREEVAKGRQCYIVCPHIDGPGGVLDVAEQVLPELRVAPLHGRMSAEEKEDTMRRFADGDIDVLVSTTVIEVGVDVPNATVMMIMEAERFGISQLHQLRGRVGRGGHESLCFLCSASQDPHVHRRLNAVVATTDGFRLAEQDLLLRQEGDILGTAQSGTERSVKVLDVLADADLIEQANRDAAALVQRNRALAQRCAAEIAPDEQEFLDKS
ncbi:ATP-dependent DNA helicase RecG [Corynebacterium uberis]|uniref:ATP-dependent DNA helicase RecG n=1 Tax=Corynebacterium TaxID=1716 RepID=UPI001D0AC511|nr:MULTISPECIES: ATP-dependent DNA helicase RecG [Corynebacterium]MCZ9309137.1 ATP-dependent DNA helicase RecG [Corynebacterium sp. c6VSa_13]UDL74401.1 ATP-dependent DNA helicase RecG [Corynebacterium uberis]UDL76765.1 ATP-dependent DNA helicase RecG [Corynebacterium uberis]UDL78978.1 ATP-dependent DNA helicase RecG [Corynebacterium uberis]UDL81255.1 ATP-dependent DNA helicase RecG [Corynebacterium uberis]